MEDSIIPRSLWNNDSRILHPDFHTSVQVTQDIQAGTSFGPCVLHNTFYDTIAFIALKSFDKRNKSYIFRVDPEAMKSSPLVVPWLRLVQAARGSEEQNTEAYLKGGQLHFRTIRDVKEGEELLVWYDEELSHLLGFRDMKTKPLADGYTCARCGQAFKNENPFLAHCRFLCAQEKVDFHHPSNQQKQEVKRPRKVVDFHNIARDLEQKINGFSEDMATSRKRNHEASFSPKSRKTVLMEKTNNTQHVIKDIEHIHEDSSDRLSTNDSKRIKSNHSTKLGKQPEPSNTNQSPQHEMVPDTGLQSICSAFSFVLPKSTNSEQKSAFSEPSKHTLSESQIPSEMDSNVDSLDSKSSLGYRNDLASHLFHTDLPGIHASGAIPGSLTMGGYYYAPDHWSRVLGGQLQSASTLTVLPPTFTPLGVSVQNWCAKCNLSFRMTSDLVFHMRSHHKKEFAAEAQVRRRREEKLTCPICNEYFRERHHLSRHMTSHN